MKDIFKLTVEFSSEETALAALRKNGFSLGAAHREEPRAIIYGTFAVARWRDLNRKDRVKCSGRYMVSSKDGPVRLDLFEACPPAAAQALIRASDY